MFDLNDNETKEFDRAILYALLKGKEKEIKTCIAVTKRQNEFYGTESDKRYYLNKRTLPYR